MTDVSTASTNVTTRSSFSNKSPGTVSEPPLRPDADPPDLTTGEKLSRGTTTAEQLKSAQSPLDNLLSDAGEMVDDATDTVVDMATDAYEDLQTLNQEYALAQRGMGALKSLGGLGEAFIGSVGIVAPEPATTVGGAIIFAHGADVAWSGLQEVWYGEPVETLTDQAVTEGAKLLGADEATAKGLGDGTDIGLSLGSAGVGAYQVLTRPVITQLEPIVIRPQARQGTAAENNTSSITKTANSEAGGGESISRLHAGDVGSVNSVSMRLGINAPNRESIRVSREQAVADIYADAKVRGVEIRSGTEANEYLDYAARQQGIPPEAMHATNIGDDLIFMREEFAFNPRVLREELIHTQQQHRIQVGAGNSGNRPALEIEAREELINNRHQWSISNDEIREVIQEIRTIRETGSY
jgi:hypothetical protein